jgi:hypothetical protein
LAKAVSAAPTQKANPATGQAAPITLSALQQSTDQLPLSFEINQGQTDPQVQFLARGSGYDLFLTGTVATLQLSQPQGSVETTDDSDPRHLGLPQAIGAPNAAAPQTSSLRMQFAGANTAAQAVGLDKLPGTVNYLIGNDPSQWHTDIATYARVEYQNLYPGIDLVYYGNHGQVEYDWQVSAGANPGLIHLAFQGAEQVTLDPHGNLLLSQAGGTVTVQAPVLYQTIGDVRQAVAGRFVLNGDNQVSLAVGKYDTSKPLVIDPVLSYSTYLSGSVGSSLGFGIAVDSCGSAYATGYTTSASFPILNGVQNTFKGTMDAFVTKFAPDGSSVAYSTVHLPEMFAFLAA